MPQATHMHTQQPSNHMCVCMLGARLDRISTKYAMLISVPKLHPCAHKRKLCSKQQIILSSVANVFCLVAAVGLEIEGVSTALIVGCRTAVASTDCLGMCVWNTHTLIHTHTRDIWSQWTVSADRLQNTHTRGTLGSFSSPHWLAPLSAPFNPFTDGRHSLLMTLTLNSFPQFRGP